MFGVCDFFSEVLIHGTYDWKTKCLRTAFLKISI